MPGAGGPAPTGGPVDTPGSHAPAPSAAAVPAGLRRLTRAQYQNTVRDLFGAGITVPTALDPDDPEAVFSAVGGYRITTSPAGVLKYEDAAYAVAHQVFADPAATHAVVGCEVTAADCPAAFIKSFGRRAWRRPHTDVEVARYTKL